MFSTTVQKSAAGRKRLRSGSQIGQRKSEVLSFFKKADMAAGEN